MATLSKESGGCGRRVHDRALGRRQQETAMAVLEEVEPFLSAEFFKKSRGKMFDKIQGSHGFPIFFQRFFFGPRAALQALHWCCEATWRTLWSARLDGRACCIQVSV